MLSDWARAMAYAASLPRQAQSLAGLPVTTGAAPLLILEPNRPLAAYLLTGAAGLTPVLGSSAWYVGAPIKENPSNMTITKAKIPTRTFNPVLPIFHTPC